MNLIFNKPPGREPGLGDLPRILRIAGRKYREGDRDYLDATSIKVLKKSCLPITKRNASFYNMGGATAASCIFLTVALFYTCSPQEFVSQPCYWRFLESISPLLICGLLLLATKRALPAFAVSLRYNMMMCLIGYVPFCLIYNFAPIGR